MGICWSLVLYRSAWVKDAVSDPRKGKTERATVHHSFVQTEVRFLLVQKREQMVLYADEPIQMQAELCLVVSGIYWFAGLQPKEVTSLVSQPELNFYFSVFQLGLPPLKDDSWHHVMLNRFAGAPQPELLLCSSRAREFVVEPAHLSNLWGIDQQKAAGDFWSFPWPGSSRTPQVGQLVQWAEALEGRFQLL